MNEVCKERYPGTFVDPYSDWWDIQRELNKMTEDEKFKAICDTIRERIKTGAPIIPPDSKYFSQSPSTKNITVKFPPLGSMYPRGVWFPLGAIPPEWRFPVSALALAEWDATFGQQITPEQNMVLRKACQFWRDWRVQK